MVTNTFRWSIFSVLLFFVLSLTFGVVFAENNKNEQGFQKKEDREEWKIPGGEPRVEITPAGKVLVRGAKITAISGNEITTKVSFGTPEILWVVRTSPSTQLSRLFGGKTTLSEFSVGDVVSFSGVLVDSVSPLTVQADVVKDWSIQKTQASFLGTVSLITASSSFTLTTKNQGVLTVTTSASTTFKKENDTVSFSSIASGDKVEVKGLFNNTSRVLTADKVYLLKKETVKPPKTLEGGVLRSVSASTTPATLVVQFKNVDYSVSVDADTALLSNVWTKINLSDLRAGDKIRIYGSESVSTSTLIEATVVRDTSIPR